MIAVVKAVHVLERLPAVDRAQHGDLREPDFFLIGRVDGERRVVPGTLPDGTVG